METKMKNGKKVILEKIFHFNDDSYTNESAGKEVDGFKSKGLPTGYIVEGVLLDDIEVGKSVSLARHVRNGVEVDGLMTTSPVMEITNEKIKTKNSTYRITVL